MITIISINKSFTENLRRNYQRFPSTEETIQFIKNTDRTTHSLFEVLDKSIRRVFLDIENIPVDQPNLVHDIIKDFNSLLNIDPKEQYVLTKNENSTHSGLSYHYIAPFIINHIDLKKYVHWFKIKYEKYNQYVDSVVYNIGRLFRLPDQTKPTGQGLDPNDYHKIIHGTYENAIIQNTKDLPLVNSNPELGKIKIKIKNVSKGVKDDLKEIITEGLDKIKETTEKNKEEMSKYLNQLVEQNSLDNINKRLDDLTILVTKLIEK